MPQRPATDQPDRCPSCWCDDCAGTMAEHTEDGCTCEHCIDDRQHACRAFVPPGRIPLLTLQLAPLLSTHLNDQAQRRCLAAAHAAHHALLDFDYPTGQES